MADERKAVGARSTKPDPALLIHRGAKAPTRGAGVWVFLGSCAGIVGAVWYFLLRS